jgi:hypothetical protein
MGLSRWSALPLAALFACSSGTSSPNHPDATGGQDAAAASDGGADDGAMMSQDGAMMSMDASGRDAMSFDSGTPGLDGGLGQSCTALSDCCATLPQQAQAPCFMAAAGGDEATCQTRLTMAQNLGQCGGAPDTGTGPVDAGPLGPACSTLNDCCPLAGQLSGLCTRVASGGNEGTCQMVLDFVQGRGFCVGMDGGAPDAMSMDTGTSTAADAGVADTGTSTTADGG